MKAIFFLCVAILSLSIKTSAQASGYLVNDIFLPELKGQVKNFTEFIISGNDTLRVMHVSYCRAGTRDTQFVRSSHIEMGFANDSTCYKKVAKEIHTFDCRTGAKKNITISMGDKGLINEWDMNFPGQQISFFPGYDDGGRLIEINTARSGNGSFQFFATLIYTYNSDGSIKQSEAQGGDQPQGITSYTYNDKSQLIKTVRTFDKDKTFTIEYAAHDERGNWTSSVLENGIITKREIQYY